MMPGPHVPPTGPMHQGRRQDHQYYHHLPPQTHSPVHHNPYAQYHHPQHYAPPYGYPQHMQQMPQWNPYHQPPPQYAMPPRQFQPHASPVVVSSHLHRPPMPPVNRSMGQTPPIVHSHTPPVQRIQTPQQAPSTPSVHSQTQLSASTPPTAITAATPPIAESKSVEVAPPTPSQPTTFKPFYPPLPWQSVPGPFPPRAARGRRRRRVPIAEQEGLALPSREQVVEDDTTAAVQEAVDGDQTPTEGPEESLASTVAVPSDVEVDTPSTSHPPSEADLTHATTPSTVAPPAQASNTTKHARTATIPAVPLIPIRAAKPPSTASVTQKSIKSPPSTQQSHVKAEDSSSTTGEAPVDQEETPKVAPAKAGPPKSWAELLRARQAPAAAAAAAVPSSQPETAPDGIVATPSAPQAPRSNTLADALTSFSVESDKKVSFIEPRGLVNTGNLCYMNSVSTSATSNILV